MDALERVTEGAGAPSLEQDLLADVLQRIVALARDTVGRADWASLTIADQGGYRTANSTGPEPLAMDEAQYREDDGPCLLALRSVTQVCCEVPVAAERWPSFARVAGAAGVTAVLSTPLPACGRALGALNLYRLDPGGFSDGDLLTATSIAGVASIVVGQGFDLIHLNEHLRRAVATREVIGEAKGILMQAQACTADEAFDILRRASQRENRKLHAVASDLVAAAEARARARPRLATASQ